MPPRLPQAWPSSPFAEPLSDALPLVRRRWQPSGLRGPGHCTAPNTGTGTERGGGWDAGACRGCRRMRQTASETSAAGTAVRASDVLRPRPLLLSVLFPPSLPGSGVCCGPLASTSLAALQTTAPPCLARGASLSGPVLDTGPPLCCARVARKVFKVPFVRI